MILPVPLFNCSGADPSVNRVRPRDDYSRRMSESIAAFGGRHRSPAVRVRSRIHSRRARIDV